MTGRPLTRRVVLAMIQASGGIGGAAAVNVCCHTFRAMGITAHLSNGGTLKRAQQDRRARIAEDDEALRPNGGPR